MARKAASSAPAPSPPSPPSPSQPLQPPPSAQQDSWFTPLSVDLVLRVLNITLLHPFICWLIPLCLRAQTTKWDAPPMVGAIAWAALVTLGWFLAAVNQRVAHGLPRDVNLDDEVIVVTGGASGLGMLVAEVYGMRGASVAVLDVRDMENGEARGVTCYRCDVGNKDDVARAAAQIEKDLGPPTVLINNAAVVLGKSLLDLTLDDIDRSVATNLLGPMYCLKAFLPSIVAAPGGGTVVNVSSVIGHLGAAHLSDYAAAKAGLSALHRSLAAELRHSHPDVRCVLVTPGQLSTPLFHGVRTPNAFVAPIVEPVEVAREIVAAVDGGLAATIGMPLYARWVDWYAVLPQSLQLVARKISGVDTSMRNFVGRPGR